MPRIKPRIAILSFAILLLATAAGLALTAAAKEPGTSTAPEQSFAPQSPQSQGASLPAAEEGDGESEEPGAPGDALIDLTMPEPIPVCAAGQCAPHGSPCGKFGQGTCYVEPGCTCGVCLY